MPAQRCRCWCRRLPPRATRLAITVLVITGLVATGLVATRPVASAESQADDPATKDPATLFEQRIMPIFRSERPSSCIQCHLASVDLKNYILPSSSATFASLRDQGLIDLDNPEGSKILELIRMGEQDRDEAAKLIHESVRKAELAAFAGWIAACCADEELRKLPSSPKVARPPVADAVIRHARKSRVVDSFARHVWSQRLRCFPCHTPHEIDPDNPRHQAAVKTRAKLAETYGEEGLQRLALFRESPEKTLQFLVESSRATSADALPLLNLDDARESLLIQKPMSKLPPKKEDGSFQEPSNQPPMTHMGGLKLHPHDHTYKAWIRWIQDYARVVNGEYQTVAELPEDNWYPSQLVVRIKGTPASWEPGDLVQLFIHEAQGADGWAPDPVAFTQGSVTPRKMVNGALFLLGNAQDPRTNEWREEPQLPRGRYLVKVYRDAGGKVRDDPTAILSSSDFAGQAVLKKARWRKGFKHAEVISGKKFEQDD